MNPMSASTVLKGAIFLAELKRKLFSEGFTLAIPEPDLGDDLWVVDAKETEPQLRRCQIKSALPSSSQPNKYTVNFTPSFRARLDCRFYFIFGLYQGDDIHFACFPSSFFKRLCEGNKIRFNEKGRAIFDFFVSDVEGSPVFDLRGNPVKNTLVNPKNA